MKISLKFVSKVPIDNNKIDLDNGLAPNRQQAIIWINADPIHRRINAALGVMSLYNIMPVCVGTIGNLT